MATQEWNDDAGIYIPAQINTSGKPPQYRVMDDYGKLTDEFSERFRDLSPDEAQRFFGIVGRTVRVGVAS